MSTQPVTRDEAIGLIHQWGKLHDEHAGLARFMYMLDEHDLVLKFRDQVWQGYEGFEQHQQLKSQFFDESHIYDEGAFEVEEDAEATRVGSKMQWTARMRPDGSPYSQQLKVDIVHRWVMRRCPRRGTPVIQHHEVESFDYVPGFEPKGEKTQAGNHLKSDASN